MNDYVSYTYRIMILALAFMQCKKVTVLITINKMHLCELYHELIICIVYLVNIEKNLEIIIYTCPSISNIQSHLFFLHLKTKINKRTFFSTCNRLAI